MAYISPLLFFSVAALLICSATSQQQLQQLRVMTANGKTFIADELGREVILRGVNIELEQLELEPYHAPTDPTLYKGQCPSNTVNLSKPPVCQVDAGKGMFNMSTADDSNNDLAQVRALGFNVIRLCLSWSYLEPEPGKYNQQFLDRIQQVVDWAAEQELYVILDMHEDNYSVYITPDKEHEDLPTWVAQGGADGAPAWASVTDGLPAVSFYGIITFNLAIMRAYDNFWRNRIIDVPQGDAPGPGLQDHYIGAMAFVARRFLNYKNVLGYEIINEPQPGSNFNFWDFSCNYLYSFYTRVIQALTGVRDGLPTCTGPWQPGMSPCAYPDLGVHDTHAFLMEPPATRNLLDFSPQNISSPITTYPNIIYAPHVYTHVFTLDSVFNLPSFWPPSFEYAYQTALAEAKLMNAAIFVTEYGCGPDRDHDILESTTQAQDKYQISSTMWTLKENCCWGIYDPGQTNPDGVTRSHNGALRPNRVRIVSRIFPRAVIGTLQSFIYNTQNYGFAMQANCIQKPVFSDVYTIVYIPPNVNGSVSVSGDSVLQSVETRPDGSRLVNIAPTCSVSDPHQGTYGVTVATSSQHHMDMKISLESQIQSQKLSSHQTSLSLSSSSNDDDFTGLNVGEIGNVMKNILKTVKQEYEKY